MIETLFTRLAIASTFCFHTVASSTDSNISFISAQFWLYSKTGEIRRDEACLDYAGTDVILYPCHGAKGNQYWEYDAEVIKLVDSLSLSDIDLSYSVLQTNFVQHGSSKNCLAISEDKKKITVEKCSQDNPRVKWKFEKFDASKKL